MSKDVLECQLEDDFFLRVLVVLIQIFADQKRRFFFMGFCVLSMLKIFIKKSWCFCKNVFTIPYSPREL